MLDSQPFLENKEAAALAQAIVDTVREPLLVLDKDCVSATPAYCREQIDAMNIAFKRACTKLGLTGGSPVIEIVAIRIIELASAGEFDPDKVTDTVVAEFAV